MQPVDNENMGYVTKDNKLVIENMEVIRQSRSDKGCDMSDVEDDIFIEVSTLLDGVVGFVGNCSDSIELLIPEKLANIYTAKTRLKLTIEIMETPYET